jgi:adenylosuccinate lyase
LKRVRGLLAKAEQFLARQRIDYAYQELYRQIRNTSRNQIEFNLLMAKARDDYLNALDEI